MRATSSFFVHRFVGFVLLLVLFGALGATNATAQTTFGFADAGAYFTSYEGFTWSGSIIGDSWVNGTTDPKPENCTNRNSSFHTDGRCAWHSPSSLPFATAPSAADIHSAHRSQPTPVVVTADLPAATSGCYSASCSMIFSPTARPDALKSDTPPVPTSPNGVCDEALQLF